MKNVFELLSLADEYGVTSFKEKAEIMLSRYVTVSTGMSGFRSFNLYDSH